MCMFSSGKRDSECIMTGLSHAVGTANNGRTGDTNGGLTAGRAEGSQPRWFLDAKLTLRSGHRRTAG